MDKKIAAFVVLAGIVSCAAIATAEDKSAPVPPVKDTVLQGEILDMTCYMSQGASGAKHMSCAKSCLKGGAPMGLLTTDGKVVLLVEDHDAKKAFEALKAKGGENMKVTGVMFERGGLAAIQVKSSAAAN